MGLQVPTKDRKAFAKFLEELGYPYVEETLNPAYRLFLQR
jgi:threonine dehydratase